MRQQAITVKVDGIYNVCVNSDDDSYMNFDHVFYLAFYLAFPVHNFRA